MMQDKHHSMHLTNNLVLDAKKSSIRNAIIFMVSLSILEHKEK
jgi:hypothetical protein